MHYTNERKKIIIYHPDDHFDHFSASRSYLLTGKALTTAAEIRGQLPSPLCPTNHRGQQRGEADA
jgi:hypothetical protein